MADIEIIDLEEFSRKKALYAKLGKYNINVNDIPTGLALTINDYSQSIAEKGFLDSQTVINDIVIPLIQRQHKDACREDILEDFNYDQLIKIFRLIMDGFYKAGIDASNDDKKKEN
ncbi:hypothetical protein [Brachyspira pulli]|uniref:hypothetical protein n=1 Tax=Brachyspira pulli TaxID=310721 RepID=UPI0030050F67